MTRLSLWALIALSATTAAVSQPRSDETRLVRRLDQELVFLPSAEGIRVASSGYEEVVADLMWVRAVLLFGERYDTDESAIWKQWLSGVIGTVTTLDPRWRTPYLYGGAMLSVVGEVRMSSEVYERCSRELPEDHWCPFSRGMNDLLYENDPLAAAGWLREAATRPQAPAWYGSAAAALTSKAGQRRAGLVYLDEQLASTTDPGVRKSLEFQRGRLRHDELVSTWETACREWRTLHGPLERPEDLSKLGFELPENPRADAWVVGNDGVVRSKASEADRKRRALQAEWAYLRR